MLPFTLAGKRWTQPWKVSVRYHQSLKGFIDAGEMEWRFLKEDKRNIGPNASYAYGDVCDLRLPIA